MLGAVLYLPDAGSASLAARVLAGRSLTARALMAAVRSGVRTVGVPSILKDAALERAVARAPHLARAVCWLDAERSAPCEPFASGPCLLLPASSLLEARALVPLAGAPCGSRGAVLARSLRSGAPVLVVPDEMTVRLWSRLIAGAPLAAELARYALERKAEPRDGAGLLMTIHDAAGLAQAERALHLALRSESDSGLDRVLHRPCSWGLTRLLSATAATPNQVTLAGLLIGALAIWCFWRATPWSALWGILLYWLANVIDHCDGELARLTFQESAFGARLDWAADTVVHTGIALAIAVTGRCPIVLATLAATGVALSAWLAPRAPRDIVVAAGRLFDRLGSRDPFYAVLVAFALLVWFRPALVGSLAVLVAVGSHAYWIGVAAERQRTLRTESR